MSMKIDYKCIKKLRAGPGGLNCPCCNPYSMSPRKMKPKSRRYTRRILKMKLKQNNED